MTAIEIPEVQNVYFDAFVGTLPSMAGKRVAITGCTTGTGFVTALTVARSGAVVVMLNRSSSRATDAEQKIREAVPGVEVVTIPCDLQSVKSVAEVASQFAAKFPDGGLDVLVCNAGVMAMPDRATVDGFDEQMQTNHLSHFLLVRDLMPELEKAAGLRAEARVVHATSIARHGPVRSGGAGLKEEYFGPNGGNLGGEDGKFTRYGQSKMANGVFHYALHDKLQAKSSPVHSILSHPGFSATSLVTSMAANDASGGVTKMMDGAMKGAQSQEDGTMPMLAAVCLPDAQAGDFYGPKDVGAYGPGTSGEAIKLDLEPHLTNQETGALLWQWSEKAVGAFAL